MAALGWTEADIAKLETRAIVAEHENERLRKALIEIEYHSTDKNAAATARAALAQG